MDQAGTLIGRAFRRTLPATDPDLLPADPRRVGVLFSSTGGIGMGVTVQASGGIDGVLSATIQVQAPPVEFYFSRHGPLPACAWSILSVAGTPTIAVYELLYTG